MRREDLIKGAKQILAAIDESKILEAIKKAKDSKPGPEYIRELLEALKKYTLLANDFSPAARELTNIFEIDIIESSDLWTRLFIDDHSRIVFRIRTLLYDFNIFVPKILEMLENKIINEVKQINTEENSKYKDKALLSVVISEPDNRFSSPIRLVETLESITSLYEVCATLNNENANDLSVIACDSGSDKSFDFLGAAKIIECVKELIISLWDNVVFYREKKLHERLALVAKSLPIIDEIGKLEQEKKIEREQAEILRRKVLDGAGKFLKSGAIIPEMEKESKHDPHLLMTPEPKLLVAAPKSVEHKNPAKKKSVETEEKEEVAVETSEEFTPEELLVLKKLAEKFPKTVTGTKTTNKRTAKKPKE